VCPANSAKTKDGQCLVKVKLLGSQNGVLDGDKKDAAGGIAEM